MLATIQNNFVAGVLGCNFLEQLNHPKTKMLATITLANYDVFNVSCSAQLTNEFLFKD